ncbi:hypothetical protein ACER0C_004918 [Sarotherodon galilaeus]
MTPTDLVLSEYLRQQKPKNDEEEKEPSWKDRSLHGMYHRQIAEVADIQKSYQILDKAGLKDSTEALILAVQEQALCTRSIEAAVYHTGLLNGSSLCSGRLEVKSNHSWSSVCEADFDQQDAEVVCRELGCGPPSVLQGALYGEVEAPVWSKEFQCGGHESALLDCRSSGSARNSCSPGKVVGLTCSESDFRLVGGASRCAGILEVQNLKEWRPVDSSDWSLKEAAVVCIHLECGSAVSVKKRHNFSWRSRWKIDSDCVQPGAPLRDCTTSADTDQILNITCSDSPDSVRLLNGSSLCSGRLEVKSNQSWSSVCEADFDQQDAEVVCRELGCGPPLVLQGALYGEVEAPVWSKEFQCGGHESALLDCRSSGSARNSCSPGKAVGLTCSDFDFRLVGGASRCAGTLEAKYLGKWRPVYGFFSTPKEAAVVCQYLDCGSAVSIQKAYSSYKFVWSISSDCAQSGFPLRDCTTSANTDQILTLTCSDSVRLLDGSSLCSGRLEVKSNQSWSSVCEADFDRQDAEVVCRELGCGPPLALQGALYGEVEAPVWSKEFQCGGHESALLDCRSSGSARNSCSPGKAVGLTCSEPDFRQGDYGGGLQAEWDSCLCEGFVEDPGEDPRQLFCTIPQYSTWHTIRTRRLPRVNGLQSAPHLVFFQGEGGAAVGDVLLLWLQYLRYHGLKAGKEDIQLLRQCQVTFRSSKIDLIVDSVRLLNGSSLCSGRLEVKSNQSWSSVCEADFDQQDAEVVCRELGCGPPSVLQGALYGEVEAPVWSKEFQCGGHESALLDCRSSGSARNSCSPGKAVGLTCSEPVRLVGGASHCEGTLELKYLGEWRPVYDSLWSFEKATALCYYLDCGSAVSVTQRKESTWKSKWSISSDCVQPGILLRECAASHYNQFILNITCSDSVRLLDGSSPCSGRLEVKSNQSWSSVCEADFDQQDAEVVCREFGCGPPLVLQGALYGEVEAPVWSKEFQCGGHESALLDCRSSGSARNSCSPGKAVGLTCSVNDVRLVGGPSRCADFTVLITMLILPLTLLLVITALYFYCQASRGQKSSRQENTELLDSNQGVCAGEGGLAANKGVQQDLQGAHPTAT